MQKEAVVAELDREPFVPLRLHLTKGRKYDVPERRAAHMLGYGLLVLIGLKPGSVQAKGYDTFAFDAIERIEPLGGKRAGGKRKRA